jgi:hypothetical protein
MRAAGTSATPPRADLRTGLVPRLRQLADRAELSEEQAKIFDRVMDTRKGVPGVDLSAGLPGPWNAMLYSAPLGALMERMGDECRNSPTYKAHPNLIEIGICIVGVEWQSQFEVFAHYAIASKFGVSDGMIAAIKAKRPATEVSCSASSALLHNIPPRCDSQCCALPAVIRFLVVAL